MTVNLWIAVRKDTNDLIDIAINWDEGTKGPYTGPIREVNRQIFKQRSSDRRAIQGQFRKRRSVGLRNWFLSSLYFPSEDALLVAVTSLKAHRGNTVNVLGAWDFDTGQMIGVKLNPQGNPVGRPTYPISANIVKYMPDITDPDGTNARRPTVPADRNLIFGQAQRQFT